MKRTVAKRGKCPRTGKARFADESSATRAVRDIAVIADNRDKKPVRAYQCPFCHGWHLTSQAA